MLISKHLLAQAKAFLCWDTCVDLTIKLVPLQAPVAFYYPPSQTAHTIVVFYSAQPDDCSQALFLLFHEIGHYQQFHDARQQGHADRFDEALTMVAGAEKVTVEREAWERGAVLLEKFLKRAETPLQPIMQAYHDYAIQCATTYLR